MTTPLLSNEPGAAADPTPLQLAVARERLRRHRLYPLLRSPRAVRTFTEHHVICVLDFMSLLKSLQRDLAGTEVPWTPPADPRAARLIHGIVADEEADVRADGRVQSHFEWYLEAMDEIGADTRPARSLVAALKTGTPLAEALAASDLPSASVRFGNTTAAILGRSLHVRAAVFFHGREEVIPEMFLEAVRPLRGGALECEGLCDYLERHVQLDGGEHGQQAEQLLERLLDGDPARREEAESAALGALAARERLWDSIAMAIESAGPR